MNKGIVKYSEHEKLDGKSWELVEKGSGVFVKYDLNYEELEHGVGAHTTAIIEIKFLPTNSPIG